MNVRSIRNNTRAVPILQILTLKSISRSSVVVADLGTSIKILNGPFKLVKKQLAGAANRLNLLAMDANQREADAFNVNFVQLYHSNLGIYS
jgi:hypothetical protein